MKKDTFKYFLEKFEDIKVLRYKADSFENLNLKQKLLIYYLYQATNSGRDIIYDQKYKFNLLVRKVFETIFVEYKGDRQTNEFKNFHTYLKKIWVSNGIHHHYSTLKHTPRFSELYFRHLLNDCFDTLRFAGFNSANELFAYLRPIIFDADFENKLVNQQQGEDLISTSYNNFYEGVDQKEVEEYYDKIIDKNDKKPISYGLNSKLVKTKGQFVEKIWKLNGMYSEAIGKIIYWLEKALNVAQNNRQKRTIELLIEYYKTGNLKIFDDYSIEWVKETESHIDFFNGFIEVYGDPIGFKATWEGLVWFEDEEMTRKLGAITKYVDYFEKNSPIDEEYKRSEPTGMSYKLINVISQGGDCSPTSPIGVNLPNADWIRSEYGSKSISLSNIEDAVDEASKNEGLLGEFYLPEQQEAEKKYANYNGKLHTGLHEVIGHGSGKLKEGIATPKETLKSYASTIEEARADLVSLYYFLDPYMVEIGLLPSLDAGKAEYIAYFIKGLLTQLARIQEGNEIEESHMRNRHLIAKWCYEQGKAENIIEMPNIDGKTYIRINDFEKCRELIAKLLREVQRIKSEGDYDAAMKLIEGYGVKTDPEIHKEVLARYTKLKIAPLAVFLSPVLLPVIENNKIIDIDIEYQDDLSDTMLYLSSKYSFLPFEN